MLKRIILLLIILLGTCNITFGQLNYNPYYNYNYRYYGYTPYYYGSPNGNMRYGYYYRQNQNAFNYYPRLYNNLAGPSIYYQPHRGGGPIFFIW